MWSGSSRRQLASGKPHNAGPGMRTLITGATGFVGSHLAECLLAAGDSVYGLARQADWPTELSHLAKRVQLFSADLLDFDRVTSILAEVRPERIAHLAGYADAGASFRHPDAAWNGNLNVTRTLYDAVARWAGPCRILYVSTGQVYGPGSVDRRLIDESSPLRPVSPYAASKAAADVLSYQVTKFPGLDVVRVRPFNQVGPRQPAQYAAGHFARQLARIERKHEPPRLSVGDLSAERDLTDVRDVANAMRLLLDAGKTGEVYNVGAGQAVRISDVLETLRSECGVPVEVVPQADRMRPADAGPCLADTAKLRKTTGWAPRYSLRQSLRDTLESWRSMTDQD